MLPLTLLSLSPAHIIIVVLLLVVLFGGRKIPELMKGVGTGIKEFKDAMKEDEKKPNSEGENTTQNKS